jgi:hypothetical protein
VVDDAQRSADLENQILGPIEQQLEEVLHTVAFLNPHVDCVALPQALALGRGQHPKMPFGKRSSGEIFSYKSPA